MKLRILLGTIAGAMIYVQAAPDYRTMFSQAEQLAAEMSMNNALSKNAHKSNELDGTISLVSGVGGIAAGYYTYRNFPAGSDNPVTQIVVNILKETGMAKGIGQAGLAAFATGLTASCVLALPASLITHQQYRTEKARAGVVVNNCQEHNNCAALLARFQTLGTSAAYYDAVAKEVQRQEQEKAA